MNEYNSEIKKLVNELTFEENLNFALSCINRLKHLPHCIINSGTYALQYLEEVENISKEAIEKTLNELSEEVNNESLNISNKAINEKIKILDKLMVDTEEDGSTAGGVFLNYLIIMQHILSYINEKTYENVYWCSTQLLEIIDAIEHEKYYIENESCVDKEASKFVDLILEKEMEKQKQIIKIIRKGSKKILNEYVERNFINFDIIGKK